jgi:AraC family L-rhamnose operon transcriptional activator RhaR
MHLPGLNVLGASLHRHRYYSDAVEPHRHRWSQVIFYLSGHGMQLLDPGSAAVEPGTVVVLPPQARHSFRRTAKRAPLCLIIDFEIERQPLPRETVRHLGREQLLHLRQELAALLRGDRDGGRQVSLEAATVILRILVAALRAAGWMERSSFASGAEGSPAIRQLVSSLDPTVPLTSVVQRSGYNRDYLNRLVKKTTGLTLGQLRNQQRLTKAKELLSSGMQVGSTAAMVGLPDQGYFARWFRRQTGHPPSRWSSRLVGVEFEHA